MNARKVMLCHPDQPYIMVDIRGGRLGLTVPEAEELVRVLGDALSGEAEE